MNYLYITPETGENHHFNNEAIAGFLEDHLDEFKDKASDIVKAIRYAINPEKGGFVLLGIENDTIVGAVVINKTGMDGYIPGNILVYIAVHRSHRGKGIGKKLMLEVLPKTEGGVALHVEPDNPARYLYQKLGFTHKYLEMRYQPSK